MDFKDWKTYAMVIVGGGISVIVGDYLTPWANKLFAIIPQTVALLGVTLHKAIAYGVGYTLGMMANEKLFK